MEVTRGAGRSRGAMFDNERGRPESHSRWRRRRSSNSCPAPRPTSRGGKPAVLRHPQRRALPDLLAVTDGDAIPSPSTTPSDAVRSPPSATPTATSRSWGWPLPARGRALASSSTTTTRPASSPTTGPLGKLDKVLDTASAQKWTIRQHEERMEADLPL